MHHRTPQPQVAPDAPENARPQSAKAPISSHPNPFLITANAIRNRRNPHKTKDRHGF
jgi:hypothetical protein